MNKLLLALSVLGMLAATACGSPATPAEPAAPVDDGGGTVSATRAPEGPIATGAAPDPDAPLLPGEGVLLDIQDVDMLILESFPVQVVAAVTGVLPNGCAEVVVGRNVLNGNTFTIELYGVTPDDLECTQALEPFQESIPLDVFGLPAGVYVVNVNGVTSSFEFTLDNIVDEPILSNALPGGPPALAPLSLVSVIETLSGGYDVRVSGQLPNTCASLGPVEQRNYPDRIEVLVQYSIPASADSRCTGNLMSFDETYTLDLATVQPGPINLVVNGEPAGELNVVRQAPSGSLITGGPVFVDSVDFLGISNNLASVRVLGSLPDGCSELGEYSQRVEGDLLILALTSQKPGDVACTMALVPFDQVFKIDMRDVPDGSYTLQVNDLATDITLGD